MAPLIGRLAQALARGSALCAGAIVLWACAAVGGADPRDTRITADVRARLSQYSELQAPNTLDVQTLHQVVYLRGLMATPFQISLASSVAGDVSGVRRVENLIGLDNAK